MTKFEKDFEKYWYDNIEIGKYADFKCLPDSMKWGVYVDFFDSVDITIEMTKGAFMPTLYDAFVDDEHVDSYKTRYNARAAALEKAIEIYNQ